MACLSWHLTALSSSRSGDKLIFKKCGFRATELSLSRLSDECWCGLGRGDQGQSVVNSRGSGAQWSDSEGDHLNSDCAKCVECWILFCVNNNWLVFMRTQFWLIWWISVAVYWLTSQEQISIAGLESNFQVESFDLWLGWSHPSLSSHLTWEASLGIIHAPLSADQTQASVSRILPLAANSWQCFNYHRYLRGKKARS